MHLASAQARSARERGRHPPTTQIQDVYVRSRDVLARWSARRLLYTVAVFGGVLWLLILIAISTDATGSPRWLGIAALLVIAACAARAVYWGVGSEIVLTTAEVRLSSRRRRQSVPLTHLSAVAVVRALPGWAIFLWSDTGDAVRLPAPGRVFTFKAQSAAVPDAAYWAKVAASPCGIAATQIYQQALAVQHAEGPLSATTPHGAVHRNPELFAAHDPRWWSPTGDHS